MPTCVYCKKMYQNKKNFRRHIKRCNESKVVDEESKSERYTLRDVPEVVLRIVEEEFVKANFLNRCLHGTIIIKEQLERFNIKTDVEYGGLVCKIGPTTTISVLHIWNEIDGKIFDPSLKLIVEKSPGILSEDFEYKNGLITFHVLEDFFLLPSIMSYKKSGILLLPDELFWDKTALELKENIHERVTEIISCNNIAQ